MDEESECFEIDDFETYNQNEREDYRDEDEDMDFGVLMYT